MTFAFRFDANLTMVGFSDGLTDGKTKTCALHEIVEFDETFED